MAKVPTVLFVCVRNAGRSQMAEALFNAEGNGRAHARSAGNRPARAVHPEVIVAMKEIGINLDGVVPKSVQDQPLDDIDVLVTMGCGDECPHVPGARVVDWDIADPAGRSLVDVRAIRDDLAGRVSTLLAELLQ